MALTPEQQKVLNKLLAEGLITQKQINEVAKDTAATNQLINDTLETQGRINQANLDTQFKAYTQSARLTDEIEEQLNIQRKRNKEERELAKLTNDISSTLNKQIKDFKSVDKINAQISKNTDLQKRIKTEIANADSKSKAILAEYSSLESQITAEVEKQDTLSGQELIDSQQKLSNLLNEADVLKGNLTTQQSILVALDEQSTAIDTANQALEAQKDNVRDINKRLGLSGGIVKGATKLFRGLGIDSAADQMGGLNEELQTMAEEGASSGDIMKKSFTGSTDALKEGLKDPLTQITLLGAAGIGIFKMLLNLALEADKGFGQIVKQTGLQNDAALKVRDNISQQAAATDNLFINSKNLTESFNTLTQQTGMLADFGGQTLETFTSLNKQLGLSEKGATQLTMQARMQGKNTERVLENTVGVVNQINKQNKSALSAKEILNDVAEVSADIAVSLGQNPEAIAAAVAEAKLLGLNLDEVAGIADGLLNIQGSLQAEMEAELILGKNLNLEKARSLALDNDMAGLAEELRNQEEIMLAFRTGNRIEQEAAAKALGLSREQMGQIIQQQDYLNLSQEEYTAAYGEQSYEQMQQLDAQEKMNASMEQFKMAMADVAVQMIPIVEGIANFISGLAKAKGGAGALVTVLGVIASLSVAASIAKIISSFAQIPMGVGIPLGIAASISMLALISSAKAKVAKATQAKDLRQRSGQKAVMSQTLGGLEPVLPAPEDDIVMGPGILNKVERAEAMDRNPRPGITNSVLESKAQAKEKVIVNNDNSELVKQNSEMMAMFKSMNQSLNSINKKESNVYLGSEQVQNNLNRSTAGLR